MVPTLCSRLGVKGHRPVVGTRGCKDLLHVLAVVNAVTGVLHANTLESPARAKAKTGKSETRRMQEAFAAQLRYVARLYPAAEHKRVVLIIDNAPWHRGKPIDEALAADLDRFLHGPWVVSSQACALAVAATAAAAWPHPGRHAGPPPPPPPAAAPAALKVEEFQVQLNRRSSKTFLGAIGVSAFEGHLGDDDVRVRARLSVPAYCYLIALNPDGTVQPCHPENPAAAPPRSDAVDFPADPALGFGLTDGVGLQAFVLVASRDPLPPLGSWLRDPAPLPWAPAASTYVWRYDGRALERDSERGYLRPLAGLPGPLEAACKALRSRPGVEAIRVLAFPVTSAPAAPAPAAEEVGTRSEFRASPPRVPAPD